jgi:Trypsin-co-occurring domain 1
LKGERMAYAEFPTALGASVLVDQRSDELGVEASFARKSDEGFRGDVSFTEAIESAIEPVAAGFLRAINQTDPRPDEVELQFGVRLHYRAGAIVSTDTEGSHFRVTLRWSAQRS